jgi:hypothetical protein
VTAVVKAFESGRKAAFCLLVSMAFLLLGGETTAQKAVSFRSPGDFVEVPHSQTLALSEFTIELWLRVVDLGDPNLAGGEQTIVDKRGGDAGYNFRLAGTSFPLSLFAIANPRDVAAWDQIQRDVWHHMAVTQDADTLKLYLDGVLLGAIENPYDSNTYAALRIGEFGGYPGAYIGLRGDIDELRIWNNARSHSQVLAGMHAKMTGAEPGLAAYFDFDAFSDTTVLDLSPNGNDGAANGNATLIDSDAPIGFIPPPAPVGLRAYGGERSIDLVWRLGRERTSGCVIYRGDSAGVPLDSTALLATLSTPESTYTDTSVVAGKDYYYRVCAVDDEQHQSRSGRTTVSRTLPVPTGYVTGVYYYPWWGPTVGGHTWVGEYLRDYLVPRQPPMLGHYSSRDPQVIGQHLDWMRSYGIDFLVSSWWGQHSWEDSTLRDFILPQIENTPVKFTVYYESAYLGIDPDGIHIAGAKEEQLVSDFHHIADTYFAHPNFLRVDDKPVVFIYLFGLYSGDYQQAFSRIRSELQAKGYGLFLVGDEAGWNRPSAAHIQPLDAISPYIVFGHPLYMGYPLHREFFGDVTMQAREWEEVVHAEAKHVIPAVHPGFNGRDADPGLIGARQSEAGAASTSMLEEFIRVMRPFVDPQLKMIMITSWNEWHEDTQIEPTIVTASTSTDNTPSGSLYTQGFSYEGYGLKNLEVIRKLLASELTPDGGTPPLTVELYQNYPNPFNPATTIVYYLPQPSRVKLVVYNVAGQLVETLVDGPRGEGFQSEIWSPSNIGSGVYFVKLTAGEQSSAKKLVLLK